MGNNVLTQKSWSPYVVGAGIGILSWFAFVSAHHPLGITTAFEHTAGLLFQAGEQPSLTQTHVYYQAPRTLRSLGGIGYWLATVLGKLFLPFGDGGLAPSVRRRLTGAFLGGAFMMIGARLANGCTSGHGISGTL